jgi:hypothetical protein
MHVPTTRPACYSGYATFRPWLARDQTYDSTALRPLDANRVCKAWGSPEELLKINGTVCDGCARLPMKEWER